MSQFKLKPWERRRLRRKLNSVAEARTYRRVLALLELDRGRSAVDVADMLGVTRQSVHNWATAFLREPVPETLADQFRSGRPADLAQRIDGLLPRLMTQSPQELGYAHTQWTVPLLRQELNRRLGLQPSDETLRRSLQRLGFVWKRPRYVLEPDPQREKKTADSPADPGPPSSQRRPGRRRDRPDDVPAITRRLGLRS